ncbi:MAG TPA: arginase family protein [Longimicrobiaceae bacterium]
MNPTGSSTGASESNLALVGAASSIGIRPYDEGGQERALGRAPAALRELGLAAALGAVDLGDLRPGPYQDRVRTPGQVRNEAGLVEYSRALAERVAAATAGGRKALVIGGDCSIVLGSLLGLRASHRRVGLVYVDAHADFATPQESTTGSAASMCLAMAVGRGDSPLARLHPDGPLVHGADAVVVARRDQEEWYGQKALARHGVLDLTDDEVRRMGFVAAADRALERVTREGIEGFWVHLDADVIDPDLMPAVDSPVPGGPGIDELVELLIPLAHHPRMLGMQVTIYDPALDPGFRAGRVLASLLERIFGAGQATNPDALHAVNSVAGAPAGSPNRPEDTRG